jgi:hypothetical protein
MKKTQLWSVGREESGYAVKVVDAVNNTETEAMLEDLLVASPDLLGESITLLGRQVPTEGGPLDLWGVDEDGRIVVFELKRDTLTRDAVAQVLDYASDLADGDIDRLAQLVQDYSGRHGVDKIEDFENWYSESFQNFPGALEEKPKMVLVGLGVDARARRVVNYLADSGIPIELLTFHAFQSDSQVFLARQIESRPPARSQRAKTSSYTKEGNLKILRQSAESLGVLDYLEQVASFIANNLGGYQWPGKTAYSFSFPDRTDEGKSTLRAYIRLDLVPKKRGMLRLVLYKRALGVAQSEVEYFCSAFPKIAQMNPKFEEMLITLDQKTWSETSDALVPVFDAVAKGARARISVGLASTEPESSSPSEATSGEPTS